MSLDREALGRIVRATWISWAREQPNPKPSWVAPWEELSEADREADRRIGEAVADAVLAEKERQHIPLWLVVGDNEDEEEGGDFVFLARGKDRYEAQIKAEQYLKETGSLWDKLRVTKLAQNYRAGGLYYLGLFPRRRAKP